MSSSVVFTGSGFSVETVTQTALATLRIRFSNDPKASDAADADDALNPANYALVGPGAGAILNVGAAYGDPQAVDLFLAGPLAAGEWSVTASNIMDVDADALQAPFAASFSVSSLAQQEPVSMGAVDDTAADILRKHLNPALKGDAWDAIIQGIATGDQKNLDNARLAFDQLFKTSASGLYLERKAGDDGVQKPQKIGMPDELFRQFAIQTTNGKLVEDSLLKILEVFYGADSVRARSDSGASETYQLQDGDDLAVLIDERFLINTVFTDPDFAIIGQARAIEVAAALNRSFDFNGCNAFAAAIVDAQTGTVKVRIYSGSLGLGSSVRVVGGKAQSSLLFSTPLPVFSGLPTWNITTLPATSSLRFQVTSEMDLSLVRIGDYVTVYGSEFDEANRGTFTVTNVFWGYTPSLTQYFDVVNAAGVAQSALVQLASNSLLAFRPTRATIHADQARAVVVASIGEEVDVVLPATSQAVGRGPRRAAYGQVNPSIAISSLERARGVVTVSTSDIHGLSIGDQVLIDGIYGAASVPVTTTGSYVAGAFGDSDYSKGTIWSRTAGSTHPSYVGGVAVTLLDGTVFHGYGYSLAAGTINDNGFYWNRTLTSADTVLPGGERQLTFLDEDGGLGVNTVSRNVNFPGASLGSNPLWFYGQVYVTGGESLFAGTRSAWDGTQFYTPPADLLTAGTVAASPKPLKQARAAHAQVTLANPGQAFDGGFFVCGGMGSMYNRALATSERYSRADLDAGTPPAPEWKLKASMNEPRAQHQAVVLNDGRILVIGGRPMAQGHVLRNDTVALWRMDDVGGTLADETGSYPLTNTNAPTVIDGESGNARRYGATSYSARPGHDAAFNFQAAFTVDGWFNDASHTVTGTILCMGATLDGTAATNTQLSFGIIGGDNYLIQFDTGLNVATTMPFAGVAATATLPWNHFSIVFDGVNQWSLYINGALVGTQTSVPATGGGNTVWTLGMDPSGYNTPWNGGGIDDVRISNTAHDAQSVWAAYQESTGELYYPNNNRIGHVSRTCEIYDPIANTWTYTGSMSCSRFNHRAVKLPDGRVLVVGGVGFDPNNPTTSPIAHVQAELWSPTTRAWSPAGKTAWARDTVMAEYLPTRNQVVVTGGSDVVGGTKTELFDPRRVKWSASSATLPVRMAGASMALLGDDCLVAVGGYDPATSTSDSNLDLYIPNSDSFFGGGLNGVFRVTDVLSSTSFQFETEEEQYTLSASDVGTVTPMAAQSSTIPGPFVFDEHEGVAVTSIASTSTAALNRHQRYAFVDVADASSFPDAEGWLVFSFGYENQVAPVKYFGRLSSTRLSLDYSFRFPSTIPAGSSVTYLQQKGPWVPEHPETVGSFYITASPAGRVAAEAAISDSVAAGVTVNISITYPGDRGLGGEGLPARGNYKLSDKVWVWGGDDADAEIVAARADTEE